MDLEALIRQYAWNLAYAEALTADVGPKLWTRPGGPGLENHPAWTIGHLVTGSALVAKDLGVEVYLRPGWSDLFERRGPNDTRLPAGASGAYPDRDEVLDELRRFHGEVETALRGVDAGFLDQEDEWRFDGYLPTNLDVLLFMLVAHENVHLGQLGCWRRRFELPSAMAAMGRGPG